jgi:transcriptional regulator with XRE-family HTH domain
VNIDSIKRLLRKLIDPEYRRAFADSHVGTQIAMQLRALRRSRDNLSQERAAADMGMAQARISLLENPDYQNYNIKTLRRIAAYYDVVLDVRFISFRQFLDQLQTPSDDLAPPPFGESFPNADSARRSRTRA